MPLRLTDQSSESNGNQMLKMKDIVHISLIGSYIDIQVLGGVDICPFGMCCLDGVEISIYMLIVEPLKRWFAKRNYLREKKKKATQNYSLVTSRICFSSIDLLGEKVMIFKSLLTSTPCLFVKWK